MVRLKNKRRAGVSAPITEALLLIVGITVAAVLGLALLSKTGILQSRFTSVIADVSRSVSERMTFVYATYNSSGGYFIIYLKNVGSQPIHAVDRATLIFGNTTSATFYNYNESGGSGTWRFVELMRKNYVWDPAETIALIVYNSTTIEPPYYFKFTTYSGTSISGEFSDIPG